MVRTAVRRLRLTRLDPDVVLGGGIMRARRPARSTTRIDAGIAGGLPPRAASRALAAPPVVGAAMLGLDLLGATRAAHVRHVRALTHERLSTDTARPAEGALTVANIVLDHVTKVFGDDVVAVDDVSLEIRDGEFMVLVGPSGCGKSTILRMIAGLEEVTAGEIAIGETQVTDLEPKRRDIAMVFQNYALYPHMSVEQNLGVRPEAAARPRRPSAPRRVAGRGRDPRARPADGSASPPSSPAGSGSASRSAGRWSASRGRS